MLKYGGEWKKLWRNSSEGDRDSCIDARVNFQCKYIHNCSLKGVFIFWIFLLNFFFFLHFFILKYFSSNKPRLPSSVRGFSAWPGVLLILAAALCPRMGARPAQALSKPPFWIVHIFILANHRMKCHPPSHWRSVSWVFSYSFISLASLLRCRGIEGIKSQKGIFFQVLSPTCFLLNTHTHPCNLD